MAKGSTIQAGKKTTKVRPILMHANQGLRLNLGDDDYSRGYRRAIIGMLEPVLSEAGWNNGYRYVDSEGNTYTGIRSGPEFDDTKRLYYVPKPD